MTSRSNFSSSVSYSVSSTNADGERTTTGQQSSHQRVTDADGNTTVRSVNQNIGEPAVESTRQFDSTGRQVNGNGSAGSRRVEDVSDEQQAENDRLYEERMEEEYDWQHPVNYGPPLMSHPGTQNVKEEHDELLTIDE